MHAQASLFFPAASNEDTEGSALMKKESTATHRWARTAAIVCVLALFWLLCTATLKRDESVEGVVAVLLSMVFAHAVAQQYETPLRFRLKDVLQIWRFPSAMVTQTWRVTVLLLRDLAGRRAASIYFVCPFDFSQPTAVNNTRRVLAASYTSATPSSIVIGIDAKKREMLLHQLDRSRLSKVTRELGARP